MKAKLFGIVVLFSSICTLFAQDDYEKWLKKDQQQFEAFLSEEDKAFSNFLKQAWEPYKSEPGQKQKVEPKPVVIPVADEKLKSTVPPKVPPKVLKNLPRPVKRPQPKYIPVPKPIKEIDRVEFPFYDTRVLLDFKKDFSLEFSSGINNKTMATAWEKLSRSKYKSLIEQLLNLRRQFGLNDWGYIQLVQSFSKHVLPESENQQIILIWFILNKSGYDSRIAYSARSIYLLFPSPDEIYDNNFITLNGTKYYFLKTAHKNFQLDKKVFSYKKTYNEDSKNFSMRLQKAPNWSQAVLSKNLEFKYGGKDIQIPVKYEKDVVTFFKNYPQTQLEVYFDAPMSTEANFTMLSALRPLVESRSEIEAVNILLRFVQTAFPYQTDDQQFGREKYLMPEETLFYPNSDCEDRSILFAYLVKHLLALRVVGLDYPGHIATAILFTTPVSGKTISYKNMIFTVCDPTFVNADAGMCMPQYQDVEPKIISMF